MDIKDQVIKIISDIKQWPEDVIKPEDTFDMLSMDSLAVAESKMMVEKFFDIEIDDCFQLRTVKNLIEAVEVLVDV